MLRSPAQPKLVRPTRGNPSLVISLAFPALSTLLVAGRALAQTPPAAPAAPPTVAPSAPAPPPGAATYYPGPPSAAPPSASAAPPAGAAALPAAAPPPQPRPYPQPSPQGYAQPYPPGTPSPYGVYAPAPMVMPDVIEDEGQPVPQGYRRERRPRGGLIVAGVGVFAPLYAFSLTAALGSDDKRDRWLALPVFGPVIDMLQRKSCSSSTTYDCPDNDGARTVLAMDFVGQATGVILFSLGYGLPREVFVRGERPPERSARSLPILLVPGMVGGSTGGPGLSAAGAF